MKTIYIDSNYPRPVLKILEDVHNLQKLKYYEIKCWDDNDITEKDLKNAIFLVVDYQKKGISIPIIKQAEEGYKTIVCRIREDKIDRFEFMMTVLRVWPQIIQNSNSSNCLYSFRYGGKKLNRQM